MAGCDPSQKWVTPSDGLDGHWTDWTSVTGHTLGRSERPPDDLRPSLLHLYPPPPTTLLPTSPPPSQQHSHKTREVETRLLAQPCAKPPTAPPPPPPVRGRGPGDPAFRAKHMGPGNATTARPDPVGPVSWEGTWLAVGPCKASSVQRPLEG
ncbi:unnamed protein product [Boreogadus saida]